MGRKPKPTQKVKAYLTTQEAATLLNISQSTVQRYVDGGTLKAEKNAITGRRAVLTESVIELAEKYKIPLPEQIGSAEEV